MEPISAIIDVICSVIEHTPPELMGDIVRNGIVMTGGGSLLYGFDRLIQDIVGIKTRVAKDAVSCVAVGTGLALSQLDRLPESSVSISRIKTSRY